MDTHGLRDELAGIFDIAADYSQRAGELNESGHARRSVKLKRGFLAWLPTVPDDHPELVRMVTHRNPDTGLIGDPRIWKAIAPLGYPQQGQFTLPEPDDITDLYEAWLSYLAHLVENAAEDDRQDPPAEPS